jgi:hypothetical protein
MFSLRKKQPNQPQMFLLPYDWFQKQTPSIVAGQKASS